MTTFTAWAPDADPHTPGVITYLNNCIPTFRGYKAAPSTGTAIGSALGGACRGAASIRKINGTVRVFAGADTAIYEFTAGAWADVATPVYTGGASNRWIFAQFGDATIATNDADQLQVATSGNFAAIANSPKARIVLTVPNFVILLNTNDGSGSPAYGDQGDRWWCSGFADHTVWTPALSTQCNTGRLIGDGGELTAGAPFGANGFVAYKRQEMWVANYVGTPETFRFDRVPGNIGCVGPEAVVNIGGAHIFVGLDDIYVFDGSRPRSIANGTVRDWFRSNISKGYEHLCKCVYDPERQGVWIFFPGGASTTNSTYALFWHMPTGKWGLLNLVVEAVFNYTEPGVTWASVGSTYASWNAFAGSGLTWASGWWTAGQSSIAFFDSSHAAYTLDSNETIGELTTHWFGSAKEDTQVSRIFPLSYSNGPSAALMDYKLGGSDWHAGGEQQKTSTTNQQFELHQTARWHRATFQLTEGAEITGFEVEMTSAGSR